ncbi:MAG: ATP-binding protein [Armatimonadota bacterium]
MESTAKRFDPSKPVGRVVATEKQPNTAFKFHFWTPQQSPVGIGSLVKVVQDDVTAYGVVIEGCRYSDVDTPMSDYIGSLQNPEHQHPTFRPDIKVYTAGVLRIIPEEPLQPVPLGAVYLADDEDIRFSLRMDDYWDRTGIPVGLYQNGDRLSPVYLDWEFLLGPEAAHMNITGVSGLGTKTSAVEIILQSVFAASKRLKKTNPRGHWSVAAFCFNVKGPDLLFLDLPQEVSNDHPMASAYRDNGIPPLTEQDREMYRLLGIPCAPFENVVYYAPLSTDYRTPNTLRAHPELIGSVRGLCWGLEQVLGYAEVMLNKDDIEAKADALLEYIRQNVVGKTSYVANQNFFVKSFRDLREWFDAVMRAKEQKQEEPCGMHHYETVRKLYNRLCSLPDRYQGLISPDNQNLQDFPWDEGLQDGTVYCIDLSKLDPQGQDLVFARMVTELRQRMEKGSLGVDHVIVFVDELNKYAPADGPDTHLRNMLLDISERGRYLGLVLFSAQQFRSQVHKRIVGNSATAIYGRMDMDELSTPGYQTLTQAVKEKLSALPKGQLMIRHPHFNQPIFVRFPRPNILRGSDGIRLYPPEEGSGLGPAESAYQRLKSLDPRIRRTNIEEIVHGVDPEIVTSAVNQVLMRSSGDGDVMEQFRQAIRRKAGLKSQGASSMTSSELLEPDEDDPFA